MINKVIDFFQGAMVEQGYLEITEKPLIITVMMIFARKFCRKPQDFLQVLDDSGKCPLGQGFVEGQTSNRLRAGDTFAVFQQQPLGRQLVDQQLKTGRSRLAVLIIGELQIFQEGECHIGVAIINVHGQKLHYCFREWGQGVILLFR